MSPPPVAYFWGDDSFGIESAIDGLRNDTTRFPAGAPERWRVHAEAGDATRTLAEIRTRVATGTMFGAGTLAIIANAGQLARKSADRDLLAETISLIADGNGLVVAEETGSGKKDPPARSVAEAIRAAGGEVRRFEAPREGALAAWIEARARERGIALGPGASRELATRVGGFVREGDVDRRHQGRIAVMELEKLGLLHAELPGGSVVTPSSRLVTVEDVRALVPEAVPGTVWGFVDAVGMRQGSRALGLLEALLDVTPGPVLLAVLHRRIRELLEVRDRLASGEQPGALVRSMRLQPFRAETLARQAQAWGIDELARALDGLLELDATIKGAGGAVAGDGQIRLKFDLWVSDLVAPTH